MTCLWCDKGNAGNSLGLCFECTLDISKPSPLRLFRAQMLIDKVKRDGRLEEAHQWHREWKERNSRERLLKDLAQ